MKLFLQITNITRSNIADIYLTKALIYVFIKKNLSFWMTLLMLALFSIPCFCQCKIESKKMDDGTIRYYSELEILVTYYYKTKNRLLLDDKIEYYNSLLNARGNYYAVTGGESDGGISQELEYVQKEINNLKEIVQNEKRIYNSLLVSFELYNNHYEIVFWVDFNDINLSYNIAGGFDESYSATLINDKNYSITLPKADYVGYHKDDEKNNSLSTIF